MNYCKTNEDNYVLLFMIYVFRYIISKAIEN